ncbi:restriction endonuclease subunit S [Staphylococcus aureus]|uniref:restriction endonuclease subunit S n=5 Tax=Staphylococcus aureus TaxID=1280 RepID=UPI00215D2FA1|nr:restriction endonuclease subunit S [Staphylococcus aureus]UVI86630.1 restriction endonuclease subunit S [Staphylococcus aureus]
MSNTQKKNVPELRFPGFEGEWEEKKLGDLTTKIGSGKTPKGGSENYTNKGIPFLRSQNIRNGKLNLNDLVYISKDIDDEMKNSRTYYGDVLLNITGASIGRTAINSIVEIHANLNQHVCIIRLKKEYYYNFFGQYLLSRKGKRKIFLAQSGGSREGLNFKEIANLKIFTPTIFEEQQKIGEFISKLDRQIELEEQKLELLQQQKKGYMQKIFSQELRFKDENGNDYPDWEEKQLGELSQIVRGASPRPIKDPKWFNKESDIGWLRISDVTNQNGKIYHLEQKLSIEGQEKTRVLVTTHLLLSIAASIGKPVMNFVKTGVHDGFLIFLNPKFNLFFMYYWLEYFKDKWSKYGQPGSQVNLNTEIVKSQTLNMPSNHEQEKVGQFFNRNEKLIELQQEKIMYLKRRKQVLLQKMFI